MKDMSEIYIDYLTSRTDEIMKEHIMDLDVIRENKILRELYVAAFRDGVTTSTKLILEVMNIAGEDMEKEIKKVSKNVKRKADKNEICDTE